MRSQKPLTVILGLLVIFAVASATGGPVIDSAWAGAAPAAGDGNPHLIPVDGKIGRCNFVTGDIHFDCIPDYITFLVKTLFGMVGGFCLTHIIIAGYQIAMSGVPGLGDKEKGKNRLTFAIVGLVVSVLAFLIVDMVVTALVSGPVAPVAPGGGGGGAAPAPPPR